MKKLIYLASFVIILASCQSAKTEKVSADKKTAAEKTVAKAQVNQEGYTLMKQFCFSCHFEKMNSGSKGKMIAPPMMMVQRHYKPNFPDKKDFINAIVKWVNKPNEADVKMPGATRKFGLMPPLPIGDEKLAAIADALYDMDFGASMHQKEKINMHQGKMTLNNGQKWTLEKADMARVNQIVLQLNNFKSGDIKQYHQLGKDIFDQAKKMMLNKSYDEKTATQIHNFFHQVEGDMHRLMTVKSREDGEKYKNILQKKFDKFGKFFE